MAPDINDPEKKKYLISSRYRTALLLYRTISVFMQR